jgi:tripartite-type tricarboxylate transporter receptor subunit TctC
MRLIAVVTAFGCLLASVPLVRAQQETVADYPNRPVKIIVTVAAGGGIDTVTRIIAEQLRQTLGQPFIIENRAGAGGNVGAEAVFHAKPDGYTLMASSPTPLTIVRALYSTLNFDPARFEPVALMGRIPNVLVVRRNFPATTAAEFMSYVNEHPGKLTYASQGIGTASHLTAELFMKVTGAKLIHVPYKGTSLALTDLVAEHVDLSFIQLASAYELHKAGTARILATATDKRLEALPDIPTFAEIGLPDVESETWNALSAPPNTPALVIAKLNQTVNQALDTGGVRKRLGELNILPGGGDPAQTRAFVQTEATRWGDIVRSIGLKAN